MKFEVHCIDKGSSFPLNPMQLLQVFPVLNKKATWSLNILDWTSQQTGNLLRLENNKCKFTTSEYNNNTQYVIANATKNHLLGSGAKLLSFNSASTQCQLVLTSTNWYWLVLSWLYLQTFKFSSDSGRKMAFLLSVAQAEILRFRVLARVLGFLFWF